MKSSKLILFAKAPVPGRVKTRLVPPLTHEQAAGFYRDWATETYETASHLESESVEIAYSPHAEFPTPQWLGHGAGNVPFFIQEGNDLGEKLRHAFHYAFQRGCERTVIIGSDSPGLPLQNIQQAFRSLGMYDVVLGPSYDGGYYLIGLNGNKVDGLFEKIPWSTSHVLSKTIEAAEQKKLKVYCLPKFHDIDRPEDLERLLAQKRR